MPKKIDLTNKKFGKLTVIREATKEEKFNKPGAYWICNCDCGTKNIVKNGQGLRKGETTSCGCDLHEKLIKRPRKNFIDETGNKYGRLTVLYRDYKEEEIRYVITDERGPDHAKEFVVEVRIGNELAGTGHGSTKKAAEQEAAYHAVLSLKGNRH